MHAVVRRAGSGEVERLGDADLLGRVVEIGGLVDGDHRIADADAERRGAARIGRRAPSPRRRWRGSGRTGASVRWSSRPSACRSPITRSAGAPILTIASRIRSQISLLVSLARGCGAMMIELRPLTALIALITGVASGLVEGDSAPITPTGLAILTMLRAGIFLDHADRLVVDDVHQRRAGLAEDLEILAVVIAELGLLDGVAGRSSRRSSGLATAHTIARISSSTCSCV